MRIGRVFYCTTIFCLALVAAALCDDPLSTDESMRTVSGKVVAIDLDRGALTVSGVTTTVFQLAPETMLRADDQDIELADIEVGSYVTVDYRDGPLPEVRQVVVEYGPDRTAK